MAGQMVLIGFQGNSVDDKSVQAVAKEIADGTVGGVMFLKTNVFDKTHVVAINKLFMASAKGGLPPFISVDQEGGAVQRLTEAVGFPSTPSAEDIGKLRLPTTPQPVSDLYAGTDLTPDPNVPAKPAAALRPLPDQAAARKIYERLATNLAAWGFNVNFGPVVDLNINPKNPIIAKYGRSYGNQADDVGAYAFSFIDAHHQHGVLTALKHFPGHGSSTKDSHAGFVDISKTWDPAEFTSFKYIMRSQAADFVMVGHLYNTQLNGPADGMPASLSHFWITDQLRGTLQYNGVVITDDMEMAAVRKLLPDIKKRVITAVKAGEDVLLFSNTSNPRPGIGAEIVRILVDEAKADPAFEKRIEQSYARIKTLKTNGLK